MGDLLTPIITAASALLGVGLTGAINARSDKRKDKALERQQVHHESVQERNHIRELHAEHKKWLREQRLAAYQSLLTAMTQAREANWQYFNVLQSGSSSTSDAQEKRTAARQARSVANQASHTVQLEGPEAVSAVAVRCLEIMEIEYERVATLVEGTLTNNLSPQRETEIRAAFAVGDQEYKDVLDLFVETARAALGEILAVG
ncbi:hypothetical protein ACFY0P_43675 [Streptomyces sp. NPDC001714]|uniref:hypothetical protein n=1 Tax=Streptomyces sp. NPDC001714 TaxID=3364603 RepID=UPI0036BC5AD9